MFRITDWLNFPCQIHLKDLVDFYNVVFDDALKAGDRPLDTSPYTRFYLPVAHLMVWRTVVNTYAKALYERGKLTKPEGQSHPLEGGGPLAVYVFLQLYSVCILLTQKPIHQRMGCQYGSEVGSDGEVGLETEVGSNGRCSY